MTIEVKQGTPDAAATGFSEQDLLKALVDGTVDANVVLADLEALEKNPELRQSTPTSEPVPTVTPEETVVSPQGSAPETTTGQAATPVDPDAEQEIVLKIRPSMLGTYAKNRSLDQAIIEMAKGSKEKDSFIDFLKKERIPQLESSANQAESKALSLQQQLDEFRKKLEEKPQAAPAAPAQPSMPAQAMTAAPVIPKPPLPLIGEDVFDEDKKAEYKKAHDKYIADMDKYHADMTLWTKQQLEEQQRSHLEELKKVRDEFGNLKTSVETASAKQVEKTSEADRELAEVDAFRKAHAKVFGTSDRPVKAIEDDYLSFVKNLAAVSGVHGPVIDDRGFFTPEVKRVKDAYFNQADPLGQKVRDAAASRGIAPPQDFDVLQKVYKVRNYRAKYSETVGGVSKPISYEAAYRFAVADDPSLAEQSAAPVQPNPSVSDVVAQKAKEEEARQRAIEHRQSFAKEAPVSTGEPMDLSKVPAARLYEVINRYPKWSDADKEFLRNVERSMPDTKLSEIYPELKVAPKG